jgi:hypothetical protein
MTGPTTPAPTGDPTRRTPVPGGGVPPTTAGPVLPPTSVTSGPGRPAPTLGGSQGHPADDAKRERRWTLAERVLAIVAALLGVVAGGLGIWGSNATAERDDLETTADSLVEARDGLRDERDQLSTDLDAAQARIEELEKASATTTTSTPDTTDTTGPGTSAPPLPGEPVFLNQLEPVAGRARTDEAQLGGQRYRNVVRQPTYECSQPVPVEYNLGAGYDRFTAKAGLEDTIIDPTDVWRFVATTIDGNGEHIVFEQELHFAQPVDVDLAVTGAQRLRLTIEEVDVDGEAGCRDESYPALWTDPKLT